MSGVLSHLKVIDLSWGVTGPMICMLLADHGADVTRIERPEGDPFRDLLGYKVWNRGKKNAIFNLKDTTDLDLFYRLVGDADILVESFSPKVTERLKINYNILSKINPKLIYCSITGYGVGTKDENRPAYDSLVAARSGLQYEQRGWPEGALLHMNGLADPFLDVDIDPNWVQGANREGPLHVSSQWPSLGAFFSASIGISAALFARENTGLGQHVETSLFQGAMISASGVWLRAEKIDSDGFNSWILGSRSPKGHLKTSDKQWVHNWVPNPRFLLESSKGDTINANPDLTVQNDPDRFGLSPEELLVMSHYQPLLVDAVQKFTCKEWVEAADTAGMTLQKCRSIEESLTDPLLLEDGCVVTVDDPELGKINQVGISYKLETSPGEIQGSTRPSGIDTEYVKSYATSLPLPNKIENTHVKMGDPPLKGIRVLDLGLAIAGPFSCQILADLGAEVIKINTLWDMFWHNIHVAYMANRGKRSIALTLKDPRGMKILKEVISTCDVIQHNMRYVAVEKLGLDYASLKEEFPQLIYCHSRGFEDGPRKNLPGNDQTAACLAGIQYSDGALHHEDTFPLWSLVSLGDTGNGFLSAIAICNALMDRKRTGKGQFVDTSIINAALLNTSYAVAKPDGSAVKRPLLDAYQTGFSPYNRIYRTYDNRWIQVVNYSPQHKEGLKKVLEITGHVDAQDAEKIFAKKRASHWIKRLEEAGVPAEISDPEASRKLFDNEEFKKRRWTLEYQHPSVGKLEQIGSTYSLSHTPLVDQGPPLIVGDNTVKILKELNYSDEEIRSLVEDSVIYCESIS